MTTPGIGLNKNPLVIDLNKSGKPRPVNAVPVHYTPVNPLIAMTEYKELPDRILLRSQKLAEVLDFAHSWLRANAGKQREVGSDPSAVLDDGAIYRRVESDVRRVVSEFSRPIDRRAAMHYAHALAVDWCDYAGVSYNPFIAGHCNLRHQLADGLEALADEMRSLGLYNGVYCVNPYELGERVDRVFVLRKKPLQRAYT